MAKRILSTPFKKDSLQFFNRTIEIWSAKQGKTINVKNYLLQAKDFHGNPNVHHVVRFRDLFNQLVGKYDGHSLGQWNPDELPKQGIVVAEYYFKEAEYLTDKINLIAVKAINNPALYDEESVWNEFLTLTKAGYELLGKHENEFNKYGILPIRNRSNQYSLLSIERAGLVTTRLALGLDRNVKIDNEARIVTKRSHFKDEDPHNITVTVKWRDLEKTALLINNRPISVCDFVNPASGASLDAIILVAELLGFKPSEIHHRSFSLTQQGTLLTQQVLKQKGVTPVTFYSVAACNELNKSLYLIGRRAVGDAGDMLCHWLPKGYQD